MRSRQVNHNCADVCFVARIDSMVTVVDAVNFLNDMTAAEDLAARQLQANEEDMRTITDLLVSPHIPPQL